MVLIAGFANAQYYLISYENVGDNPGSVNQEDTEYPYQGGLATGWTPILGPSLSAPTYSDVQTIPFSFEFNDSTVTVFKASSSGFITFDTASTLDPGYTNESLPST